LASLVIFPVSSLSKALAVPHTVYMEEMNGYLEGKGAYQAFSIYCKNSRQNIEFTQPEGADFWVKVLGKDDSFLDDFQLSEGEVIILKGGNRFTLVVRSEEGSGAWSAKPVTED